MPEDYSAEQIEFELSKLETPPDVKRELELELMRAECGRYGLTPHLLWLSLTGRVYLASIIVAHESGDTERVRRLERAFMTWTQEQE